MNVQLSRYGGLRKATFAIDGAEANGLVEGWTDGTTWNGWANVLLKTEDAEKFFGATADAVTGVIMMDCGNGDLEPSEPQAHRDLPPHTVAYDLNGYCFVELVKCDNCDKLTSWPDPVIGGTCEDCEI